MVGGLLNLISQGVEDKILIGNLNNTFFTKRFVAHSNFGKQKFRIDFEGSRKLNYNSPTFYNFKIPRYGDLLQEVFFSFTLPNIWSPLISFGGTTALFCSACRTNISTHMPNYYNLQQNNGSSWKMFVNDASYSNCSLCNCECNTLYTFWNAEVYEPTNKNKYYNRKGGLDVLGSDSTLNQLPPTDGGMKWLNRIYPLEFKWIENIGVQAIKSVRVFCNDTIIQEFTGQYLLNMVYRDFSDSQKKIFNKMIGNTNDLINPANYLNRNNNYPNAAYFGSMGNTKMAYGLEPSIRSKQLFIPINLWSTLNNKTPIPLVSMQYSELRIEVEMRPVNEWWVVKNVINEVTIKSTNKMIKYKSPLTSHEEEINLFEISNETTGFYTFDQSAVVQFPPTRERPQLGFDGNAYDSIAKSVGVSPPAWLGAPQTGQAANPDFIIAPEMQLAIRIPLDYTAPNCSKEIYNLRYFLKEPPPKIITDEHYDVSGSYIKEIGALPYPLDKSNIVLEKYYSDVPEEWFADVHLIGCYTFLTNDEQKSFAKNCQSYLIKEVHEQTIRDLVGGDNYTTIESQGLVISWMWFFQRSDIKYRNEWSNYTNFNYNLDRTSASNYSGIANPNNIPVWYGGALMPYNGKLDSIVWQTEFSVKDTKDILLTWGFYLNSTIRETVLDNGIVAWVDRYTRSKGSGIDGVYYYNFCLNTDPLLYQPSGAINMSKINKVNWSYTLQTPLLKSETQPNLSSPWNIFDGIIDPFLDAMPIGRFLSNNVTASVTCDSLNPELQTTTNLRLSDSYVWSYNLHIMEERYNIFKIENGIASLVFARSI